MARKRLPTWREMIRDTSPEAEQVLFSLWREAPAWKKWQQMARLNHSARLLAMTGLRRRYPHASKDELRRRLADRAYGPLPDFT